MKSNRRQFIQAAGTAGAALLTLQTASADDTAAPAADRSRPADRPPSTTELFLDNQLLEATPGVSRKLHPAKKHLLNPVIRPERWCEGTYIQPYTTMYDAEEKLFKMWARAGSNPKAGYVGGNAAWMLYYTSQDGVHWEKPDLGVCDVGGRRDHNVVFASDLIPKAPTRIAYGPEKFVMPTKPMVPQGKKAFFWGVNKHPQPRDPSENYVALAIVQDHCRGAHIVTSPDGVHWSCAASPFWQTPHDVAGTGDDCLMHLMFDEAKRKWVIYRRIIPEFSERMIADDSDRNRSPIDRYNRSYAYAESDDLREWKNHRFILAMDADDPADTELYQFGCHKFGATYVGYVSIFYLSRPQPINIHLATSRDGIHFTRVCRGTPFIPHGPLGNYDFMAMACSQPQPIVVNDTIYIYYAAFNFPHNVDESASPDYYGGVALASLKRDRFSSLETGTLYAEPCRLLTKPLVVSHPRLYLNAATWGKGSIRVEVLTRDWQPIPGFTVAESREILGRRSRPSSPLVEQRRLGRARGPGDSAQVPHDTRPAACDDHERSRAASGACGSRVSIRRGGRFRSQAELNPLIPYSDTQIASYWDARWNRFVVYLRFGPPNVRVISRIESEDFLHWSPKVTVVRKSKLDTPFSTELHTMGAMPYHGIYIGVFNTYHGETTKPIPDDQRIGLLLDITVWPITGTNAEAARQLYAVQDRFGMEDVRFSGYWNNADLIGGQTNEIKASTYRKPRGGALVVVFNTAREARAAAQRRLGSIEVGRPARGFRRLYADARRGEREGRHA